MTAPYTHPAEVIHFVSGEPYQGNGERSQAVFNPATGAVARQVRLGTAQDVDVAVASAAAAFPKWADTPPIRRARVMFKFLELMNRHKDELAAIITAEHGKVLSDAPVKSAAASTSSNLHAVFPNCSRATSPTRSPPAWTTGRCASRWAWWQASRRSISLAWCRAGCSRSPSPPGNCFILKPSERDPSASLFMAPPAQGGRTARWRFQRRAR